MLKTGSKDILIVFLHSTIKALSCSNHLCMSDVLALCIKTFLEKIREQSVFLYVLGLITHFLWDGKVLSCISFSFTMM